jgi:hypothetical protein
LIAAGTTTARGDGKDYGSDKIVTDETLDFVPLRQLPEPQGAVL